MEKYPIRTAFSVHEPSLLTCDVAHLGQRGGERPSAQDAQPRLYNCRRSSKRVADDERNTKTVLIRWDGTEHKRRHPRDPREVS